MSYFSRKLFQKLTNLKTLMKIEEIVSRDTIFPDFQDKFKIISTSFRYIRYKLYSLTKVVEIFVLIPTCYQLELIR